MMKKRILCGIFSVLLVALCGCGNASRESGAETAFYENSVITEMTRVSGKEDRLETFSKDLCVIDSEESFDPELVQAGFAGLFCEDTKKVLYAKNSLEKMFPASLTKLMTGLLAMEKTKDLDEKVTVGPEVSEGLTDLSSKAGLTPGCTYTLRDLLTALYVPSGNDAANALAVYVSGSIPEFVDRMNERAKELGMINTHFVNPHGLHDEDHYTTVYDFYLLTHECLKQEEFCNLSSQVSATIFGKAENGETVEQSFETTNSFFKKYVLPPEGIEILGGKTGYTEHAKRNLVLVVQDKEYNTYIAIIGHAETYDGLYQEMNVLLSQIQQ